MPIFQIPSVYLPTPEIFYQRQIRPGEVTRYSVESEWSSPNGHAKYSYEMRLENEKAGPEKLQRIVVARLENLRAQMDDQVVSRRLFGVIPFELGPSGPPQKLNGGGALNTYVYPLLAFILPSSPPGPEGTFELASYMVEGVGALKVTGCVIGFRPEGMELAEQVVFGGGNSAPVMTVHSWYRVGRGQLLRAEGTYAEMSGTLSFRIKKL
ncbi:hypothetical protein [Fimbriimonas ginsengisoli]|uniref:Uncharacterized protein n=1 Tax=Fimbriimonas ginsengisoli Gsoil 348 TaxID=661478 RepID=A0A068NYT4_FIMGI|nr:hypothetical protein [Fimbriimonas ginsengisoli]AIE87379.1 hypothetical protein OP10G_4011 [Fimbriimonas ginsengisoli Gsoil 348]